MRLCFERVERWHHLFVGAETLEAERGEIALEVPQVGSEMFGSVRVGAKGDNRAAKVTVKLEDLVRGLAVFEAVAHAGRVEFDAFVCFDDVLERCSHKVAVCREAEDTRRIVTLDEVGSRTWWIESSTKSKCSCHLSHSALN